MPTPGATPAQVGVNSADRVLCAHCAQVIGAYEPLVVRVGAGERESSLAAEPELPLDGAEHLHLACALAAPPRVADVIPLERAQGDAGDETGGGSRRMDRRRHAL